MPGSTYDRGIEAFKESVKSTQDTQVQHRRPAHGDGNGSRLDRA
jgi:hypothetical protein